MYGVCVCGTKDGANRGAGRRLQGLKSPPFTGPNCTFTSPLPPASPKDAVKPDVSVCAWVVCVIAQLCVNECVRVCVCSCVQVFDCAYL